MENRLSNYSTYYLRKIIFNYLKEKFKEKIMIIKTKLNCMANKILQGSNTPYVFSYVLNFIIFCTGFI